MNRLTKIVATIGPSCESEEMIAKLIEAGVNIFRFNFKHNEVPWHEEKIELVNKVARKLKTRVGTLIDLQGPEIRINMPVPEIKLEEGDVLVFGEESFTDTKAKGFSISHPEIIPHLKQGQKLIAVDGEFEFLVNTTAKGQTTLTSLSAGTLKHRKSLNIPGADFPFPVLIDRDFDGLKLAARKEVDYVALSFVRTAADVLQLRKEMVKYKVNAQIVSKIETQKALDHLDEIVEHSDGLMVARGDLGVELSVEQVPFYQKLMIKKATEQGKFVITATQMLQTMITSSIPTRAEVSDVANATYDMTDAVMLSGETASGKYPVKAVTVMRKTIEFNETKFLEDSRVLFSYQLKGPSGMICDAAYNLYLESEEFDIPVKAFMVFTKGGNTARLLSSLKPNIPIYAFCPNSPVAEQLMVNYAVYPIVTGNSYKENIQITHNHVLAGSKYLRDKKFIKKGDRLIVVHGDYWEKEGGATTIKYITV